MNKKKALSVDYQAPIAERDNAINSSSPSSETSFYSTSSNISSKTKDTSAMTDTIIESSNKTDMLYAKSDNSTSSSSENSEETPICVQDSYSINREEWDTLDGYSFKCNSMHNNNDPSTIKSSVEQDIDDKESIFLNDEDHLVPDKDLQLPFVEDVKKDENGKLSSQHNGKQSTDMKGERHLIRNCNQFCSHARNRDNHSNKQKHY